MQEGSEEIQKHCLKLIGGYQAIIDAEMYVYKLGIEMSNDRGLNTLV